MPSRPEPERTSSSALPAEVDPSGPAQADLVHFETGARLMTGIEYVDKHPEGEASQTNLNFFLLQARIGTRGDYGKRLRLKLSLDLADALDGPPKDDDVPFIRDAWLRFRVVKGLILTAGRFKRPWSRLQLTSAGDLPFRGRGVGSGLIVKDSRYGDRGVGLQASGRVWGEKERASGLDWALSLTTPDRRSDAVDVHTRLDWTVSAWLAVGASVSQKAIQPGTLDSASGWLGGHGYQVDARVSALGWELVVDGQVAEDLRLGNASAPGYSIRPDVAAVAGYVSYDIPLGEHTALQPTVFAEWADRDLAVAESEVVRVVLACNVLWNVGALRVMPQVEVNRPQGRNAVAEWKRREAYSLMFSSEF